MRPQIVKIVGQSRRPLTLPEVQVYVPGANREVLDGLVDQGVLYPCSRRRYWDRDETAHLLDVAWTHISRAPRTKAELCEVLAAIDPHLSLTFRRQLVDQLRRSTGVWTWPAVGRRQPLRLATRPPDPEPYVRDVRARFARLKDRLLGAGLEEATVVAAVVGRASTGRRPAAVVAPSVLHELAFAWADASVPEARALLERVLVNIGAERLGERNQTVPFDGRFHDTDDDLFPDEPAQVVEPGWIHGPGPVVIVKARVIAAP